LRNLELYEKYYPGDIGLRHGFLGYRDQDIGGILEHVVYQELRHRGYRVMIGKWEEREVDFVAETGNERLYVQVTTTLAGREVIEREYAALEKIPDNHPKLVLSMDADGTLLRGGIRQRNLMAFLLEG
jgi:hypothetical protein